MAKKTKSKTYNGAVKLRDKLLANGDRSLYLDIYHGGKRQYQFLHLYLTGNTTDDRNTLLLAETARAQRELELKSLEWGLTPTHVRGLNVAQYIEGIGEARGHKSWRAMLLHFKECLGSDLTFQQLTPEKLNRLRSHLLNNVSRNTAWLYWGKVTAALNEAVRRGILQTNPIKGVEGISREKTQPKFLTIDEVRALKKAPCPNEVVKRAFLFSCFTGMARCDVRALRWGQLRGNILDYRRRKTDTRVTLPLHVEAAMIVGTPGDDDEIVFKNLPGDRYVGIALTQWAQRAGVTKVVTYHSSRHTFGTMSVTCGVDVYVLMKLMGHSKISMTEVYAEVVADKKEQAIASLPTL